jgi:hypothetical protein
MQIGHPTILQHVQRDLSPFPPALSSDPQTLLSCLLPALQWTTNIQVYTNHYFTSFEKLLDVFAVQVSKWNNHTRSYEQGRA